ncbi:LOW QUALITY PROTEIN: pyruvate decarboxylase [Colletotrichum tofieldiae]|nr:LOW QUALITY PROTEIN: pyruvate decarboxylase [Colletotrichum tofieldiae]
MSQPHDDSPSTVKLAEYLFTRLHQLGIGAIHGVPGDFNLHLLDYVKPAGLLWVGNTNELNAGYAADGYARIKGIGALITTSGVGELSAINAIAGAYAERAAVIHIVGTPARALQDARIMLHHGFNDGEYRRFAQMHAHVTVAQADLRHALSAPDQIDEVLEQCLIESRPVYIQLPQDLVSVPVPADKLQFPIRVPDHGVTLATQAAVAAVLYKIRKAKQPMILVDGEARPLGIVDEIHQLVKTTGWPTWTSAFGKSLVDETLPNVHGVYSGKFAKQAARTFVEGADLVLCFGPHFSSTNTSAFSSIPKTDVSVLFYDKQVKVADQFFRDVVAKSVVISLLQELDVSRPYQYVPYPDLPRDYKIKFSQVSGEEKISHSKFWHLAANIIRPGDVILGETGTSGHGCRALPLPAHTRLFIPATWLSIGYMLPAAQGAALAQRELIRSDQYHNIGDARTILFIGDGSFQMTVQEISTIIRHNLDVIIFLINNDGYTIERCIHGLQQSYNDVAPWHYLQAPTFFGGNAETYVRSAKTWGALEAVFNEDMLLKGEGLRMVEIFMDRDDVPEGALADLLETNVTEETLLFSGGLSCQNHQLAKNSKLIFVGFVSAASGGFICSSFGILDLPSGGFICRSFDFFGPTSGGFICRRFDFFGTTLCLVIADLLAKPLIVFFSQFSTTLCVIIADLLAEPLVVFFGQFSTTFCVIIADLLAEPLVVFFGQFSTTFCLIVVGLFAASLLVVFGLFGQTFCLIVVGLFAASLLVVFGLFGKTFRLIVFSASLLVVFGLFGETSDLIVSGVFAQLGETSGVSIVSFLGQFGETFGLGVAGFFVQLGDTSSLGVVGILCLFGETSGLIVFGLVGQLGETSGLGVPGQTIANQFIITVVLALSGPDKLIRQSAALLLPGVEVLCVSRRLDVTGIEAIVEVSCYLVFACLDVGKVLANLDITGLKIGETLGQVVSGL